MTRRLKGKCRRCKGPLVLTDNHWMHDGGFTRFLCQLGWLVQDGLDSQNQNDYALAGPSKGSS